LAEAVRDVLSWRRRFSDWRDAWDKIMEKYGHYHKVESFVLGFHESKISSLARRTIRVMKRTIHKVHK